jgi:hypothetical protein
MSAPTRRRFTWSISGLGNRLAYAFVVAIVVNIGLRQIGIYAEALALAVGLIVFLALTAAVHIGRRQAGSDRQP